jgi:membrane protein YqaA with SNARE-associated domain
MSAGSHGAGCGVVLGIVLVLLAQQFAFISLSVLGTAIEDLVLGAILGGILGGLLGWSLGRRYLRAHPEPASPTPDA